ncbi:MAG: DUF29 domain-containing protein [Prochloron sp. SP5CPC1]|nr:DUF29 domain-containing protein [Candidatus Paraprochloron terpiosi SP5CPC1]
MAVLNIPKISNLYEKDYYLWLQQTTLLLRNGELSALDIPNLIEELEDMGKKEKRSVYSNLKILLFHLLKYKYQPEKRSHSWKYTIEEHRQRIKEAFEDSPSLQNYCEEIFVTGKCYRDAKKLAVHETGFPENTFPSQCPFSLEEVLAEDYFT